MKSAFHALFLSLSCLIIFSSCDQVLKNSDAALKIIPAKVSSVTVFRIPQLMEKADFEQFKKLSVYREMIRKAEQENPTLAQIAEDPASSGVDLSQNFYVFNQLSANNPEQVLSALVLPLKDVDAFETMIQDINTSDIQHKEGYKMVISNKSYLVWNESVALLGASNRYSGDISGQLAAIMNGEEASIVDNKDLQKCMSQDHDIVTWVSSNAIAEYKEAQMMMAGMGFDPEALKDNFIHGYLNFEKGEVSGHSNLLLRKALSNDLDLLFKDKVKTDFSPYVPGKNLSMAFSAALDFKGLNQVLSERPQSKSFLNYALKGYGLSIDDISKALGGDLMVAAYKEAEGKEKAVGLFATNIDDRAVFDQFLQLAIDRQMLEKTEEDYYTLKGGRLPLNLLDSYASISLSGQPTYLLLAHDIAFFSTDTDLLQSIKKGGFKKSKRLDNRFSQQVQNHAFAAILDFENIGELSQKTNFPLEDLNIRAGKKRFDFDLKLEDQKNNSLKSLLWMMNEAYEKEQLEMEGEKAI